jgi:3-dehydroquinate dehydratase
MGGYLTFASLEEGEESAAGQIPIGQMKEIVHILRT